MSSEAARPVLAHAFPEALLLGDDLVAHGLTVAVAESCTGGLLGAALTSIAGSSRYVRGGVIAYSNDVKRRQLGVGTALLESVGAVSREVAEAMAEGVRTACDADVGIGVTGIAGPGNEGGTKPVGLIYVAVATPGGTEVEELRERGDREANRAAAVRAALRLALRRLEALPGPA